MIRHQRRFVGERACGRLLERCRALAGGQRRGERTGRQMALEQLERRELLSIQPVATPFTPVEPMGSMVYDQEASGQILVSTRRSRTRSTGISSILTMPTAWRLATTVSTGIQSIASITTIMECGSPKPSTWRPKRLSVLVAGCHRRTSIDRPTWGPGLLPRRCGRQRGPRSRPPRNRFRSLHYLHGGLRRSR